jgi:hypothetical protein
MKINEKILKYADNRMTESECMNFENELKSDPALMKQWEMFNKNINEINYAKRIETDSDYFDKILPTFYRKNIFPKQKLNYKFTFGFTALAAVMLLFFIFQPDDIEELKLEPNTAENVEYFDDYLGTEDPFFPGSLNDEADSLVYELIAEELGLNLENNYRSTMYEYDFNYYEEYLSDNEADFIYGEIIGMSFFNGESK